MILYTLIFWIGYTLSAPTWFWVLWGVGAFIKFIDFGVTMYKSGKKAGK